MNVSCSETEFACACFEDDAFLVLRVVGFDELFGDVLGSVGGAVVDYYYFPVEGAVQLLGGVEIWLGCSLLLGESLVEQPDDDGQVLALVEGGQKHRVLVLDGHCCCCEKRRAGRKECR